VGPASGERRHVEVDAWTLVIRVNPDSSPEHFLPARADLNYRNGTSPDSRILGGT
jgi:hypothetical protein